jgi:hypothetical protein
MPHTDAQWLWFVFYTGGAGLAWVWASLVLWDAVVYLRETRRIARTLERSVQR